MFLNGFQQISAITVTFKIATITTDAFDYISTSDFFPDLTGWGETQQESIDDLIQEAREKLIMAMREYASRP